MRLTRDDAFRLIDQFEEFIHAHVGQDVLVRHSTDQFIVEYLGTKSRKLLVPTRAKPEEALDPHQC